MGDTPATHQQAGSRPAEMRYKLIAGEIGAATGRPGRKHSTTGEEHTMKLVYFDDFKLGVLKNDAVVDVSAAVNDIPHRGSRMASRRKRTKRLESRKFVSK